MTLEEKVTRIIKDALGRREVREWADLNGYLEPAEAWLAALSSPEGTDA